MKFAKYSSKKHNYIIPTFLSSFELFPSILSCSDSKSLYVYVYTYVCVGVFVCLCESTLAKQFLSFSIFLNWLWFYFFYAWDHKSYSPSLSAWQLVLYYSGHVLIAREIFFHVQNILISRSTNWNILILTLLIRIETIFNQQMLVGIWVKENTPPLFMGRQTGAVILGVSGEVVQKTEIDILYNLTVLLLDKYPELFVFHYR